MSRRESRRDESLKRKKGGQERRGNGLRRSRVNKVDRNRLPLVRKLIALNVRIKAALCLLRGDRL